MVTSFLLVWHRMRWASPITQFVARVHIDQHTIHSFKPGWDGLATRTIMTITHEDGEKENIVLEHGDDQVYAVLRHGEADEFRCLFI
jgi:hypothetical protein